MAELSEKSLASIEAQSAQANEDEEYTSAEIKSIIRRIDVRVVGVCTLGYACSLMDRTNTGYAAISG